MRTIPTSLVLVLVSFTASFSQVNTNPPLDPRDPRPEYMRQIDIDRARQNERVKRVVDQSRTIDIRPPRISSSEQKEQRKANEQEKQRALEEINKLLSTPPEYGVKHAVFLRNKNTGLGRIFPERGCDKGLVVSVEALQRCSNTAPIRGAGSRYSFRLNKIPSNMPLFVIHSLIAGADIHFVEGKFVVGTKLIQDIIADIGEVDLADVTLKSDSVKFLRSFEPGNKAAEVAIQNESLAKGISENGFLYSTSATIALNRTYVLRSVAFSTNEYGFFWNTDVLTAFKVVGQEKDGSVVILWKELKESRAPFLRK